MLDVHMWPDVKCNRKTVKAEETDLSVVKGLKIMRGCQRLVKLIECK